MVDSIPADNTCQSESPPAGRPVCTLQRPRQSKSAAVCTLQRPPQSKSDVVCTLQSLRQSRRLSVVGYNGGKNAKSPCAVSVIDTTHGLLYILFTSLPLNISCLPPPPFAFCCSRLQAKPQEATSGGAETLYSSDGSFSLSALSGD